VKTRFQNLPFKCNLQRYSTVWLADIRQLVNEAGRMPMDVHK
jgi:hypothetical protein